MYIFMKLSKSRALTALFSEHCRISRAHYILTYFCDVSDFDAGSGNFEYVFCNLNFQRLQYWFKSAKVLFALKTICEHAWMNVNDGIYLPKQVQFGLS